MQFSHRLIFKCTACLIAVLACDAQADERIASWNFREGKQGWIDNAMVTKSHPGNDGWTMEVVAPDPFITSPRFDAPTEGYLQVNWRMRSSGGVNGQLYFGNRFTEDDSRSFAINNDGKWHDYQVILPASGKGLRLRLDPSMSDGTITLDWMRVKSIAALPSEAWARPDELRCKKAIGGGLYTIYGDETAITPRYLAQHAEFANNYPFDGIVVPAQLSAEWVASLQLTKYGKPLLPTSLHELIWTKIEIPDDAVAQTIADMKSMRQGSLTDNFMIYGMVDGARGLHTPDLTNDEDWAILQRNAALAARVCRDGRMKGFWLDTEQYSYYRWRTPSGSPEFDLSKPQGHHFPLGKDTPELLRRRGAQWIQAVQAEFPEVKIITTFAWSPDGGAYGPLTGVIPFLDGVLEGISAPGEIIHGHENTFYFGQAPGTTHAYATPNGFPGDRQRFELARTEIRNWRGLSSNPLKYDTFVKVGMAAWVEDHPWNTPAGWPDGSKASLWSNLPLALAYSDEYVWVWSEHTKYGQPDKQSLNPFLASLNNQTTNGNNQPVQELSEDFDTDPLRGGWTFDFDMLRTSRKLDPVHEVGLMSNLTQPYRWDTSTQSLLIQGINHSQQNVIGQRRRFVRAIEDLSKSTSYKLSIDFVVDKFGADTASPIAIGLFHSLSDVDEQSLVLHITNPQNAHVAIRCGSSELTLPLNIPERIQTEKAYRVIVAFDASTRVIQAGVGVSSEPAESPVVDEKSWSKTTLPANFPELILNEIGAALLESTTAQSTTAESQAEPASQIRIHAIRLVRE